MNTCPTCGALPCDQVADHADAQRAIARLREGLLFYSDPDHDDYSAYPSNYGLSVDVGHIITDGGAKARALLTETPNGR